MMREIVLDTETTGLDPAAGHRVIDIGCVELEDHYPTGKTFQAYLNPDRDVPEETTKIHGLTNEFLADKPHFADICEAFLAFLGDAKLVIHNAAFDLKFVDAELERVGKPPLDAARAIDTIEIAKRKLPGARYSLDELCKRFGVDLARRDKHGALLDADLTAQVYFELIGGRQQRLSLAPADIGAAKPETESVSRTRPHHLPSRLTAEEETAHRAFVERELGQGALWNGK
jgi:DNA polymerase III subunit epsilon